MKSLFLAALTTLWVGAAVADDETVTPINDLQRGTMATLQGVVERLTDEDEFVLRDETGDVDVYVGPNWVPVDVGERIVVRGFVDDGLFIEVYAREITRADGSVVTFERRWE